MISSPSKKTKGMFKIKSQTLISLLTIYFASILNISFWNFAIKNVQIQSFLDLLFGFSLIFFIIIPLFLFFNLFCVKYICKPFLTLIILLSSISNYAMVHYGIFINKDMIQNIIETNSREALDLITFSSVFWIFITGIIPIILLWIIKIEYKPFKKELKSRLSYLSIFILLALIIAITLFKEYASFGRNHREVKGIINVVNYINGTQGYIKRIVRSKRKFQILDEHAKWEGYEDNLKTVFIMMVGETARAANFSLDGYKVKTNPLLEKQDIVYFKEVNSCGTATSVSVSCIFSNLPRTDFNSVDAKYTENLLDLLERSGYEVIWRENDDGCKGVCARVDRVDNMVEINNKKYCTGKYCHDEALLDGLEDILKNIKKNTIIVLHTMGSHGPTYFNRYPDNFKKFTPTCDTANIQNCSLNEIINTYDNTILYTDFIISSTIDIMKKFPQYEGGVMYVSDHGESLGERNIYLHGMPYNIAPAEQTEIPMIFWMNENMKKYDNIDYDCLKRIAQTKIYSHDNLFHSLLTLLEVKSSSYDEKYDFLKECIKK